MSFFYNLSTRAKLLFSFLLVIVINFAILVSSINSMSTSLNASVEVDDILTHAFARISRVQVAVENANLKFLRGLNKTDVSYDINHLRAEMKPLLQEIYDSADAVRPDYFGTQDYADMCRSLINKAREGAKIIENDVIPHTYGNETKTALDIFLLKVSPVFAEANSTSLELLRYQAKECIAITRPASDPTVIYVNAALAVVSTIIAIILAIFISNYIAKAVKNQIAILERMASGDFAFHIPEGHNDEFGRTHSVLRQMRIALNDIIVRTKNECATLQDEMRHLQNLSNAIVDNSANVETQAVTVSAASDEMVSTTQDIARNCENAASSSNLCKNISDNGLQQVIDAVNSIREQSERTKDNAQKIESLAQQTKEIGSIVSTIDDIAAQTNLLALNAAIEAARAGEAGRGFAVVADEVRALASRTTASTQEISKMVKHIQDEAALATDSITSSVVNMESVAENSSKTEELLKEITHHVIDVNQQITQIATAAEEQTTATSEISMNMQNITHATSDMTQHANHQNEAMDKAYNDLEQLIKALSFFKTRDIEQYKNK